MVREIVIILDSINVSYMQNFVFQVEKIEPLVFVCTQSLLSQTGYYIIYIIVYKSVKLFCKIAQGLKV